MAPRLEHLQDGKAGAPNEGHGLNLLDLCGNGEVSRGFLNGWNKTVNAPEVAAAEIKNEKGKVAALDMGANDIYKSALVMGAGSDKAGQPSKKAWDQAFNNVFDNVGKGIAA